jgi:hypothetical protein
LKYPPWKTQIAKHECEAKTISVAAVSIDQSQILGAKRVVAHHPALIGGGSLEAEPLRVGEQFAVGMVVPVEVFEWTSTLREKTAILRVFWREDSTGVQMGQSAALYCRVSTADQTCSRQERDLRAFAKKAGYQVVGVWKETASGAKDDRAERKKSLLWRKPAIST